MGTVLMIDIIHVNSKTDDDLKSNPKLAIIARILLEPDSSCEHEIVVAQELMGRLDKIQKEAIEAAINVVVDKHEPESEDTGETFH
jgi:hypothetical protein